MTTSASNLPRYVYKPIQQPDSLRMLEIFPGQDNDQIHIKLSHQPLCSLAKCHDIIYDGQVIKGTSNLITVLRHLRRRVAATPPAETKFLWIDGICIDQDDDKDKAKQLPLMSKIYGDSAALLMWIGEETTLSREVFETISLLSRTAGQFEGFQDLKFDVAGDRILDNGFQLKQLLLKTAWPDVIDVLALRSYFTRLWIMQEVALANEATAQVLCGDSSCSWLDFHRAARLLNSCKSLRESIDVNKSVINTVGNLRSMQIVLHRAVPEDVAIAELPTEEDGRSHDESSGPMFALAANSDSPTKIRVRSFVGFPLMASLGYTELQQRQASKRHDRVFALLGMVNKHTSELLLPVNYNVKAEEIFKKATCVMVLESQLLNHFIWMDVAYERPQLPSWVGFSDFEPQDHFPCPLDPVTAEMKYPITFEFGDRVICRHDVFKFVEGYVPVPLDELLGASLPHAILVTGGFVFDQVRTVSQNFCTANFQSEILGAYHELKLQQPRPGGGPEVLLQTICFFILFSIWVLEEFGVTKEVIEDNKRLGLSGGEHQLVTRLFLPISDSISSRYSHQDLRFFLDYSERGVGLQAMCILQYFHLYKEKGATTLHYGRNLFFGSRSDMGIGPMGDNRPGGLPAVQVGDQIVILARLGLPVILRPLGDGTHSLIGPAYIPGIADDALLQPGNMPPLEDIRIR
ncbi:heterokaryon incompatibility protein-domain-containing protein [Bisporella sp. PMI_857]|nr:heterokaryon incompatibility protein-domain-containing protein [Bisporella sp. PMI_857]